MNSKLLLLTLAGTLVCSASRGYQSASGKSKPAARQTQAPAATVDACALVTREDAKETLGIPLGDPIRDDSPPFSYSCTYGTAEKGQVSVNVAAHETAAEAAANFQQDIEISRYREIPGLGDRAYDASPALGLAVLKGRYEVSIDVRRAGYRSDIEAAKKLAATAIKRLP